MKTASRACWTVLALFALQVSAADAAEWYISPTGQATGQGTRDAPWDIGSTLSGGQKVAPGDTIWLAGGTYHHAVENGSVGYVIMLAGREDAPIQVRGMTGTRVTIDGGLSVQPPSTYLTIRDLEITVSEPHPAGPLPPDHTYRNVNRPWGGLSVSCGKDCHFINLVIHDNSQGVSWWSGSHDSELYGCIIYNNGWAGTDRGHGHAVYTQNAEGVKSVSNCIMTGGYGYSMHAYGSPQADVANYLVTGNIVYRANTFLLGGEKFSRGIRVLDNDFYKVPVQIGYTAPENGDCEIRDNVIVDGSLAIHNFKKVINENNLLLNAGVPRPTGMRSVLRSNRYDPDRANVAIYNWTGKKSVNLDVSELLKTGDHFRLLDPTDFYGKPRLDEVYHGRPVPVPVDGEFAAFVLLKGEPGQTGVDGRSPTPPLPALPAADPNRLPAAGSVPSPPPSGKLPRG